jgi:uncharacterized membrane protein
MAPRSGHAWLVREEEASQEMWLYMLPSVAMTLLAIPLILRRVPPNPLYGLRIPATYKDDQVWYDANAATGRDMAIHGVCLTLLSIVLPVAGVRDMAFAIAWSAALGAGAICTVTLGWRRANRMFRERQTRAC